MNLTMFEEQSPIFRFCQTRVVALIANPFAKPVLVKETNELNTAELILQS